MPARRPHATAIVADPGTELSRIARPLRLSEEVCVDLQRRIARGEIKPGDRLPTEKALGEAFGVSRAVVREAIARLKADGLIETRQGSGAFAVAAVASALLPLFFSFFVLFKLKILGFSSVHRDRKCS